MELDLMAASKVSNS